MAIRKICPECGQQYGTKCRERIGKQKYVLTVEQSRHLTL